MDPFLTQLAELCRTERTRAKWVLVPSHALGHTLGERLAREGTSWANLRFATPLDLALLMAAPFLVERGIDPAPDGIGPALVMRLLLELPSTVPAYFRHLAEQPKMAEALWGAIRELRMAGLSAADLPPQAFESPLKHAELAALLAAYEVHLASQHLADTAAVYREALQHPDVGTMRPGDLWTELPGVIWAPLERQLLDVLPGTWVAPRSLLIPGLLAPRRLTTPAEMQGPTPTSDADLLAFLMSPSDAPEPVGDGNLAMFRAGGMEAEVEEVFRRILHGGFRFDQAEIACASADYVPLVWEKAQRHGWPVTVSGGLPVSLTRPARALFAFCEWVERGFPARDLRRLLQSGNLRTELDGGLTAGQAARLLARSRATWGRGTYTASLVRLAASSREQAADVEEDEEGRARYAERAAQAERLAVWIEGLLAPIPEPNANGVVRLADLLAACVSVVTEHAATRSDLDGAAAALLGDALRELGVIGSLHRPLRDALALVRNQAEPLTVGADRARPGHLFVTSLSQAGWAGRPHTFVVGLEEGRVFPSLLEDAVLLDSERQAIHGALPIAGDRVSESLSAVVSRLAALRGRVCLSFSCRDLRQHRETFPSWLVLQALRAVKQRPDWTYQDLRNELGEPVSVVPAAAGLALSDAGWWLAQLNGAGSAGTAAVRSHFPWLAQGAVAEASRASSTFIAYNGLVPAAGVRLDPRRPGGTISATALEQLARCPFRHFLRRGLGVEPIEDAEPDRDQWLDPATRGHLLHGFYATILRELQARGESVDLNRHGARLGEIAEAHLRELMARMPPPSPAVFEREAREIHRDLDLFLRLHTAERGRNPVGFEVSFGGGPAEGEPLAQPEPVLIDLSPEVRFQLRGRIDRIDRLADGTYEIIDYKTGRYRPDEYTGTFQGGRLLQHALYALAATSLLRRRDQAARVSASTYYLPTVRGQSQRPTFAPAPPAEVAQVLRDLLDVLAAGAFNHTDDKDECKRCDFGRVCGPQPFVRARQMLEDTGNPALAPYRRLALHE